MGLDHQSGTRVGGYVLGERVGQGGMGVVYRATHIHLGRDVALKLLAPELAGQDDFRERFLRESRLAASLDHPNAVTVYDAGDADGTLYIAMRYVEGTDLAQYLRSEGSFSPAQTLSMLEQVGSALDAAHQRGLIHRDVKPANVLIASGTCYLTDFGLTKRDSPSDVSAALTRTGQFLGTVDYVAPEQIEGAKIDGRVDVYALACMLHECLTGSRPFPKGSVLAIISAHLHDPPPRTTDLRPELPAAIDDVVATGMAKAPQNRYSTCAELLAAALGALEAAGPETRRSPGGETRRSPGGETRRSPGGETRRSPGPEPSRSTGGRDMMAGSPAGEATVVATRDGRPGRRRVFAAAALLGAAVIAVVAVVLISGGTTTRKPAEAAAKTGASRHTGGAPPPAHVVGRPIKVGTEPTGVAGNASVLWVANFGASTVTRVTLNGKVRTDIALKPKPFAVLNTGHAFWVSSAAAGTVTPISTATGLPATPVRVGNKPEWMAGDENAVYVSNAASDSVSVINTRTGKLIGPPINVGAVPRGIALSGTAVWVADSDNDRVDRIVDGQVIKRIPVGHRPIGVAFGDNAVWVANENDNTVSRIDLTQDSVKTIKVGRAPFAIAFGLGSAWVTNSLDDTVTRLDAATGEPVGSPIAVGQDPTGIAVINHSVWVTNRRSNTAEQIQP